MDTGIKMHSVSSSNIAALGYEEESNTLAVEFNSGALYHYADVPREVYEALDNSQSIGKFFNANIKKQYDSERVS